MKSKKIDSCLIELENNRQVFYPGEQLNGNVYLQLNQSMDTECIEVECVGKVEVEWKETRIDEETQEPYEVEFDSEEKLMKEKVKVFGCGDRETLPEGEHRFPFCFQLPGNLSSSFEGEHGYIRYKLKIKIKKSWKKDLKLKRMFVVNEIIDVNQQRFRAGPGDNDEKTLGCLCWAQGPLSLSVNLDRAAFCPGEFMMITAQLGNTTSRELDRLLVELKQHVEFRAKLDDGFGGSRKNYTHTVATIKSGKIAEESNLSWASQPFAIPPLIPTLTSNKFIEVKYSVHICVEIPMAIDIDFNFPITIGTIPCIDKYGMDPSPDCDIPQNRAEPKAPKKLGGCNVSMFGYNDMPPWLYSQILGAKAVKLNKDDDHDKDYQNDKYNPLYAFAMPMKIDPVFQGEEPMDGSGEIRSYTPQEVNGEIMPPIE